MLINNVTTVKEERRLNLEEVERLPNFITKIQNELSGLQNEKQGGDKRQRRVSSLVHDNIQSFDKTELMQRLQLRLKESQKSLIDALMKDKLLDVQIRNDTDELVDLNEELQLEEGDLLQRSLMRESIRLIVFNTLGHNDESDMKSDTHSLLIALSIGKNVFVYDSVTGTSVTVFEGDTSSSFVGSNRINGHTAIVTAISFHGKFIYSGAKDNTIRCWNIVTKQLEYVAEGHNATITSICCTTTMLISGSADKSVMLWNKCNGEKLRNLNGHSRGVLALCEGNSVIVSGDADGEICLWDANNVSAFQQYFSSCLLVSH
jgi:WD40 repeat protein